MPALPPEMQKYIAMMLQKGAGAGRAPQPTPIGGTPGINPGAPSPYQTPTQFPPSMGGPQPMIGSAGRGPFPQGFNPNAPRPQGPPPAGPGGGGTPVPGRDLTQIRPPGGPGQSPVPPGAGGMFQSGPPMNPERLTGVGTGGIPPRRPMPPGAAGPQEPGSAIGAATTAGAVPPPAAGGVRPDAAAIGAINPSVFQEQQGLMNKQRAQANWLQGGAGIDDAGMHTRGKYGTYVAANPLSHAAKAFARGKGGKDIKKLTKQEQEQIEELRGFRKETGKAVRQAYGMGAPEPEFSAVDRDPRLAIRGPR